MKGAVFLGNRQVVLEEFPDPEPGRGEVVVRIEASGLCGSDLHRYRPPREVVSARPRCSTAQHSRVIVGHEPAGVVSAVGPGVPAEVAAVGDRVMVHHYAGCSVCEQCRSGWPQMCLRGNVRVFGTDDHGAHAPYLRVPASTLVPLDERLSFVAGAAIGCGTGTAWGALQRLGDIGGATLVVFGQGPVGLSATMLAAARGARVIAVDLAAERLAQARVFGAAQALNPVEADVRATVRELTGGRGASLALETSGSAAAATGALASLAPWGRACFVGLPGRIAFEVREILRRQLTLMTSWSLSIVDQQRCADFIAERGLPVDDLFTHRWTLDQVADAYAEFDKQTAGKAALIF